MGAEAAHPALVLRTIGALEPVVETTGANGPCTFSENTLEDEKPGGFRGVFPFDQTINGIVPNPAVPPAGDAPLGLVGPEPWPVFGRVHLRMGALKLQRGSREDSGSRRPGVAEATPVGPLSWPFRLIAVEQSPL